MALLRGGTPGEALTRPWRDALEPWESLLCNNPIFSLGNNETWLNENVSDLRKKEISLNFKEYDMKKKKQIENIFEKKMFISRPTVKTCKATLEGGKS